MVNYLWLGWPILFAYAFTLSSIMPQRLRAAPAPGSHHLMALSWNLLRDLRDREGWRWEQRRGLVLQGLRDSDADVLALQEVAPDMRQWLEENLADIYDWTPSAAPQALRKLIYGGVVAFRRDRFRLRDHGQIIFPPFNATATEDSVAHMPCLYGGHWALLEDTAGDGMIAVLSIHVPHQSQELRFDTMRRIADWLAALPPDTTAIISGDFNEHPDTPVHRGYLALPGLNDARLIAGGPDAAAPTKGDDPRSIIDWVLYRGVLRPVQYRVIDLRRADIAASDHRAVIVQFAP